MFTGNPEPQGNPLFSRLAILLLALLFLLATGGPAWSRITLQGHLNSGQNPTEPQEITIRIYDAPENGRLWYEETQTITCDDSGKFELTLGTGEVTVSQTPESPQTAGLWVEVELDGHTLTPRLNLAARGGSSVLSDGDLTVAQAALRGDGSSALVIDNNGVTLGGLLDMGTQSIRLGGVERNSWPTGGSTEETDPTVPDSIKDGISWSELSGIPAGFADGTDDTGITEESDPTVPANLKDGVSWSELSGIPAGFADGTDNDSGGTITGVTAGSGLSGGGTTGNVSLSLATPLTLTGSVNSGGIISTENNDANAGWGLYGKSTGSSGRAVFGEAHQAGSDNTNFGGYFIADGHYGIGALGSSSGTEGIGIKGRADGTYGVGVLGQTGSATGKGVYGWATSTASGPAYGGYFYCSGLDGTGVYGEAGNSSGSTNYGGYFKATGDFGRGVYGLATSTADTAVGVYGKGPTHGVYGWAEGSAGRGVTGWASASGDNENYGGYFKADGDRGRGVYGLVTSTAGNAVGVYGQGPSHGVYGRADGSGGHGTTGWASASGDNENYGGYFRADGDRGRGVYGWAPAAGDIENFGGYFKADGDKGRGVYGLATSTAGSAVGVYGQGPSYGIYGRADGESGRAVAGWASATGDVENYGGLFRAYGDKGYGVKGECTGSHGCGVLGTAPLVGVRGVSTTVNGSGVSGISTYNGEVGDMEMTYGGYFTVTAEKGIAVFGLAQSVDTEKTNIGGYFLAQGREAVGVEAVAEHYGSNSIGVKASGAKYDFYASGLYGTDYGPFTGAHDVKLADNTPKDIRVGMVMSLTGELAYPPDYKGTPSISSTLPTVTLSCRANDPRVLGALVSESSLPSGHWYPARPGDRFGQVNAVGEGRVWVCDLNGAIQAGDYITTSPVAGYGQKQDDDIMHSYTLGKVTESPDWEKIEETVEYQGRTIKVYLIGVVYTSG